MKNKRIPQYNVNKIFPKRWSPRAMSEEEITNEELMSLFEAARWAPSSYNNQPWRFIYAKKNTEHWKKFYNLMVEFNKQWAKNAAVLIVVLSKKNFTHNNQPSVTAQFDTGAAWQNLALQGSIMGLVVHGMQGFDYIKTKFELKIPEDYDVMAMIAVGKKGKKKDLPKELREKEIPSDRKKVSEFAFEGTFKETPKNMKGG
ncbi:MAG: nitroreductase family protein [archaeon]